MIREINSHEELLSVFGLMKELRPHLTHESFVEIYHLARKADGYALLGCFDGAVCVGLMGMRVLHDYVHASHLYIDDLVVSSSQRSKGIGARLLQHAEEFARAKGLTGLRLCTGIDNEDGMRFYERENWKSRAVVYKKKLSID